MHVDILLSSLNGAPFLGEQLESFRAQTHADWTLRFRDDGSTDGSRAMLASFGGVPLADDGAKRGRRVGRHGASPTSTSLAAPASGRLPPRASRVAERARCASSSDTIAA